MWGVIRRGMEALTRAFTVAAILTVALAPAASAHGAIKFGSASATVRAAARVGALPRDITTPCSQPSLDQAFLSSGDFNYYAAAPGPGQDGSDGSTWSLRGGAGVVSTALADGTTGSVLDLPAGSRAVSPDICVTSQDPLARVMVQSVPGGGNVAVGVSYYGPNGWSPPQDAGTAQTPGTSWAVSPPLNLHPDKNATGWQIIRFTFTPRGGQSEFHIYGLGVAAPPPTPSTGPCSNPVLSQAFLPAGDTNFYTPAPGQTAGGFIGTGWTLAGGARIVSTTRADGSAGHVLDLPAGSMAVSPNICVTSLYPTARMMIRSLNGGDAVSFRVSYAATDSWTNPHETGHVNGNLTNWTLSDSVHLEPSAAPGWQIVRLTLVPTGGHSEFQIYDLQLDPYAKG